MEVDNARKNFNKLMQEVEEYVEKNNLNLSQKSCLSVCIGSLLINTYSYENKCLRKTVDQVLADGKGLCFNYTRLQEEILKKLSVEYKNKVGVSSNALKEIHSFLKVKLEDNIYYSLNPNQIIRKNFCYFVGDVDQESSIKIIRKDIFEENIKTLKIQSYEKVKNLKEQLLTKKIGSYFFAYAAEPYLEDTKNNTLSNPVKEIFLLHYLDKSKKLKNIRFLMVNENFAQQLYPKSEITFAYSNLEKKFGDLLSENIILQ